MKSPRLNVSLPPEVAETIAAIAAAQGVSQAAVVREVMVEAMPVLAKLAGVLDNLRRMEAEKGAAIRGVIAGAEQEAQQAAATMMALLSKMESSTKDAADAGSGRSPAPRSKASRRPGPPSC